MSVYIKYYFSVFLKAETRISTLITVNIYTALLQDIFFSPPPLHHNCYLECKYSYYCNMFSVRHTVNVFRRKDKALTETSTHLNTN